jgi:serine/threonine-protein kinase
VLAAEEGTERAIAESTRALELDPRRAGALTVLARATFRSDWDAQRAEARLRRAIELDPTAPEPHHALASLYSMSGRHEEAIAELRQAQRAAPLSAAINDDGCWFFYRARRPREAVVEAERALTLEPGRPGALECIVDSRLALHEPEAAQQAAVAWLRSMDDPAALEVAAAPATEAAVRLRRRQLSRLEEESARRRVPPGAFAMTYGQLGDRERTLEWLARAVAERDPVLLLVGVHPAFDVVRDDPRLAPLLRRAGVAHLALAAR